MILLANLRILMYVSLAWGFVGASTARRLGHVPGVNDLDQVRTYPARLPEASRLYRSSGALRALTYPPSGGPPTTVQSCRQEVTILDMIW